MKNKLSKFLIFTLAFVALALPIRYSNAGVGIVDSATTDNTTTNSTRVILNTRIGASCKIEYVEAGASINNIKTTNFEINYNQGSRYLYLNNLKPDTKYYFSFTCNGSDGNNYSTDSLNSIGTNNYTFTTTKAVIDKIISNVVSGKITLNSAIITFNTTRPVKCAISYSVAGSAIIDINNTSSENSFISSHSINIGGLKPGSKYYFDISCVDENGNTYGLNSLNSSGTNNESFTTYVLGSYLKKLTNVFVQVKGSPAVYWLSSDNKRYLFSNRNVFSSWFGNNFKGLKVVPQNIFSNYTSSENLTLKPGSYLKFDNSDIKYYVQYNNNICRSNDTVKAFYVIQLSFESDYNVVGNCE